MYNYLLNIIPYNSKQFCIPTKRLKNIKNLKNSADHDVTNFSKIQIILSTNRHTAYKKQQKI